MPSPDTTIANEGEFSPTATVIAPGAITNTDVSATAAIAFSKLAALPSGDILVGSAGTVPTAVAMSGDATIIASGALTLAQAVRVETVKVHISSAEILALNGTPKTLVAAPGSGKVIVPLFVFGQMSFGTAAYAVHVNLGVGYAAGSDMLFTNATLLAVSSGVVNQPMFPVAAAGVTGNDSEYVANADLVATVATGDPTTGAGTLNLYVTYAVVTL